MAEKEDFRDEDPLDRELNQHIETARFYFAGGQWARGAEAARKALSVAPNCAPAHALLALCAANLGKHIEALREAEAALALDPNEPYYFYACSVAALAAERPARAEEEARKGLHLDPERAYLHLQMFEVYAAQRRMEEAKAYIRYAVYLAPLRADYHLKLAIALVMTGEKQEGDKELQETLRLDPENATALKLLGVRQIGEKKTEAGVSTLRSSLALDPDDAFIQRELIFAQKPFLRVAADPGDSTKIGSRWQAVGVISLICAVRAILALPMRTSDRASAAPIGYFLFCALCLLTLYFYAAEEMLIRHLPEKVPMLSRRLGILSIFSAQAFLHWFYWTI